MSLFLSFCQTAVLNCCQNCVVINYVMKKYIFTYFIIQFTVIDQMLCSLMRVESRGRFLYSDKIILSASGRWVKLFHFLQCPEISARLGKSTMFSVCNGWKRRRKLIVDSQQNVFALSR